MGNWYTGTNTNSIRTTWIDSLVYPKPYATAFNSSNTGTFPVIQGETGLGQTVFFEHEIGTDQINPDGSTTALTSFVESFSFSLQKDQSEVFLAMRRFLPNFKVLTGNNQITLSVKDFPADDSTATNLSPFTITSSTTKVDTRARGRYANIKIENTGAGESWRFGTFQVDLQPDGRIFNTTKRRSRTIYLVRIRLMANIYKNEKTSLTTTALTTLYTVPSNSRAIVKSLLVSEDAGSTAVVKVTLVDAAAAIFVVDNDVNLTANQKEQVLSEPLIMKESEILKVQASSGAVDVIASVLEINREDR
jgi:hypothetical protein